VTPSAGGIVYKVFGQRGAVVRTRGADSEEINAAPSHQDRLTIGVTLQHATVVNSLREILCAKSNPLSFFSSAVCQPEFLS
jgi:hypothetical protein